MKTFGSHLRQTIAWMGAGMISASLIVYSASFAQAQQDEGQTAQQQSQATPQPGQQGDWGKAGPPPDAVNGRIPPPPSSADANQSATSGQEPPSQGSADEGAAPPPPVEPGAPEYQNPNEEARPPYQGFEDEGPVHDQEQAVSGPVIVRAGAILRVQTDRPMEIKKLQAGDYFEATVAQGIYVGSVLAIPRGATVTGRVVESKKSGDLKGNAQAVLAITDLHLGDLSYPLTTSTWEVKGPGKGGYTAGNAIGAGVLGALVGAIAGGGPGAAIGAVAGTGVGLGASAATSGPRGVIPPESLLTFKLLQPVRLQPISYQEAQELEENTAPQQRYPRAGYPPPGYAYPGPYGFGPPDPAPYPYGVYYHRFGYW